LIVLQEGQEAPTLRGRERGDDGDESIIVRV
jgi:hypothetical protein